VEYKINFLAPAWGQKMVARGEVLTAGRRLFVCKAEVVAAISGEGEETPCAALQQTIATAPAENK
jgi:acyl-coenzyme A thioesterase PaaI-like protein